MDARLRDRLTAADGERRVLVGAVANAGGDEEMARHLLEHPEDVGVRDAVGAEQLDEPPARAAELGGYGACHQLSAASSTSRLVRSRCSGVTEMYPSWMARKSESSVPAQLIVPPPIQ